jgi:hypothetical protein
MAMVSRPRPAQRQQRLQGRKTAAAGNVPTAIIAARWIICVSAHILKTCKLLRMCVHGKGKVKLRKFCNFFMVQTFHNKRVPRGAALLRLPSANQFAAKIVLSLHIDDEIFYHVIDGITV